MRWSSDQKVLTDTLFSSLVLVRLSRCHCPGIRILTRCTGVRSPVGFANLRFICALRSARVVVLSGNRHACPTLACLPGSSTFGSVPETADHAETRGVREASTGDDVHLITDHAVRCPILHTLCW